MIGFLLAKHFSPIEIHRQLTEVYGDGVMGVLYISKCCGELENSRMHMNDYDGISRASTSRSDLNLVRVEELILENRLVAIRDRALHWNFPSDLYITLSMKNLDTTKCVPRCTTVSGIAHCDQLRRQREAIGRKRSGLLSRSVILQPNDTAVFAVFSLATSGPATLQSDIAPLDFFCFVPLKEYFGGRLVHSNEKVEMSVREWLRMQEFDFYRDGIFKFVPRWDKRINVLEDYVEK
jgi:hypothetical protein